MAGGGAVDDDDVPVPAAFELLDLAEHDDVVDAGRRGGDDVDHAGRRQPLGDPTEAVFAQVLLERGRRRDLLAVDVADEVAQHGLAVELDDEHAVPGRGGGTGENGRYRGLADTPFAGHDRHARGGQQRRWIDELRRHLCAD